MPEHRITKASLLRPGGPNPGTSGQATKPCCTAPAPGAILTGAGVLCEGGGRNQKKCLIGQ